MGVALDVEPGGAAKAMAVLRAAGFGAPPRFAGEAPARSPRYGQGQSQKQTATVLTQVRHVFTFFGFVLVHHVLVWFRGADEVGLRSQ